MKQSLKKLQKLWYNKLKDKGFVDIEDTSRPERPLKDWHGLWFRKRVRKYGMDNLQAKVEYYRKASHLLNEQVFKNKKHRAIWEMHCAGEGLRKIGTKFKMDKMAVDKIIKVYQKLIL